MDVVALDRDLARLRAAVERIGANLLALETDPTWAMLDVAELEGCTADRVDSARAASGWVFGAFASLCAVVERATIRRGDSTWLAPTRMEEVSALVRGSSIAIADEVVAVHDRGLLGGSRVTGRCTPDDLVRRMVEVYEVIRTLLADVAELWATAPATIGEARSRIATLAADASALGIDGPTDLDRVSAELDELAAKVVRDPLAFGTDRFGAIDDRLDLVAASISDIASIRVDADAHLDRAHAIRDRVRTALAASAEQRRAVAIKFCALHVPPAVDPDGALERALTDGFHEVERHAACADWSAVANGLVTSHALAADLLRRSNEFLDACRALMLEREELRGRLDAYEAMAAGGGYSEHTTLVAIHAEARTTLFSAPLELDRACELVDGYGQQVHRLRADHSRRERGAVR